MPRHTSETDFSNTTTTATATHDVLPNFRGENLFIFPEQSTHQ
jgi:hypothetical protein